MFYLNDVPYETHWRLALAMLKEVSVSFVICSMLGVVVDWPCYLGDPWKAHEKP